MCWNLNKRVLASRVETQVASFSEQGIWYKFNSSNFNCNPINTYLTIAGLTVEFKLGPNESVYFNFTCKAHIEVDLGIWSRVIVLFSVDGIKQPEPSAEVGMYNGGFIMTFMLHLQTVRHDLSSGIHNVTVVINGQATGNNIYENTLIVQKVST